MRVLKVLLTRRWLGYTLLAAAAIALFVFLGKWQWNRSQAADGTLQNLFYAFNWWIFAALVVYGYGKTLHEDLTDAAAPPGRATQRQRQGLLCLPCIGSHALPTSTTRSRTTPSWPRTTPIWRGSTNDWTTDDARSEGPAAPLPRHGVDRRRLAGDPGLRRPAAAVRADNLSVVKVVGAAHGYLYIVYLLVAFDLARRVGGL